MDRDNCELIKTALNKISSSSIRQMALFFLASKHPGYMVDEEPSEYDEIMSDGELIDLVLP